MRRFGTIIRIIFSIIRNIFTPDYDCGRCKYVLGTAYLSTLTLCVTARQCNIEEAAIAVGSAQTVQLICYYFALYHYYCNYFFNYMSEFFRHVD
jgi:hypothetical protein